MLTRDSAVALTAYARAEDRTRAFAAGFDAHVAKPVDTDEPIRVVAKLVGRLFRPRPLSRSQPTPM